MIEKNLPPAKVVLIILDGVGDTTHVFKNGRVGTCLQCSDHPTLDALTSSGIIGLSDAVSPGFPCGSDTAHLSLFGYPPFTYYNGRGAFEALGGGMDMEPGSMAFKSNFSTLVDDIVVYRRCDRHFEEEGPILCKYLDGIKIPEYPEIDVAVAYATEHRCAVRISGPGLSDKIKGTDPLHDNLPLIKSEPLEDLPEAVYTANVVNALSRTLSEALEKHEINIKRKQEGKPPANVILLRGPGMRLHVQPFNERHNVNTFMIAPTAIIAGLGISVGLPIIKVPGGTGDMDSNYNAKAIAAARELETNKYDMAIIHMKGIDDASHDGNYEKKAELIERADKAIRVLIGELSKIEEKTNDRFIISVIADHSTSSTWKDHTFEPVPCVISEVSAAAKILGFTSKEYNVPYISPDFINTYDEQSASKGSLGRFCGAKLLKLLFYYARK